VEVNVVMRQRRYRIRPGGLLAFARRLSRRMPPPGPSELAVCLVSDRGIRRLNRRFRGCDVSTDVLAFPGDSRPDPQGRRHLGDVVISVETARRQARERGHSSARELKLLTLHGYLHLLGFDHERDDGAMLRWQRRLERELLAPRPERRSW
jgi:probable rRNA maturation factor